MGGLWHSHKFRAPAGNTKIQFPGARGTFGGKKYGRPKGFSPKFRDFLTFDGLANRTPRAGNCEILVFSPFWPLALRGIQGAKQKKYLLTYAHGVGCTMWVVPRWCAVCLVYFTHAHNVNCTMWADTIWGHVDAKNRSTPPLQLSPDTQS